MKIKYLGHASFLITSKDGKKLVTDPYESGSYGGAIGYTPIKETVDAVTVSHNHEDHNCTKQLPGKPTVIKDTGSQTASGMSFAGIATYHDESKGSERGKNNIYIITIDGMKVCHLGDLGHRLSKDEVSKIGPIEILLIPVGGYFTIDAKAATDVMEALKAKITIPMHFKTKKVGFPIDPVDKFLEGKKNAKKVGGSEIEVEKEKLPTAPEIWVLEPAL
ncbi:MAG: MBL fold metallo-hydrolase [Candidatus Edwardsbacteria bacterium]